MNFKMMGRFMSQMIAIEAVFVLPALGISLARGEWNAVDGFLCALVLMLAVSGILYAICRKSEKLFGARECLPRSERCSPHCIQLLDFVILRLVVLYELTLNCRSSRVLSCLLCEVALSAPL